MDICNSFEIACALLCQHGYTVNSYENFEFYEIVGKHFPPEGVKPAESRLRISEFILKNKFHYQVFLPATSKWSSNALADLQSDIIKRRKRPPSPREVFAAAELIKQEIHLIEFRGNSENDANSFHHAVFAPEPKTRLGNGDEGDKTDPLIILYDRKRDDFGKCAEVTGSLESMKTLFSLSNEKHKFFCFARFRNSFSTIFNESVFQRSHTEYDLYRLVSIVFYGNKKYAERVRGMICSFENDDDHTDMVACLLDQQFKDTIDKKKLVKQHVEKLRADIALPPEPELFAVASIFRVPLFVNKVGEEQNWKLYMPLTNEVGNLFDNPVMLHRATLFGDVKYKMAFTCEGKCLCEQARPEVKGKFAIFKDHLSEEISRKIAKESCCPTPKRHNSFHGHYKDIEGSKTRVSEPVDFIYQSIEVKEVQARRLDYEKRRIDQIGNGSGTIQQCLSKEIYGDESKTDKICKSLGDFEGDAICYLQKASQWTKKTIYLLSADTEELTWKAVRPGEASDRKCRYYITILQKKDGHFDRIIPKCGCNCEMTSPMFETEIDFSIDPGTLRISREAHHLPMVTFFPVDPTDDDFDEDKRISPTFSPYSEMKYVCKREDMIDRCIDVSSDYTYSLYRCISKEIFGTEKHFYSLMELVMAEVREHPRHYGKMYEQKTFSKIRNVFKFKSTIEKENADFYANRIEDGLNLEDLELLAVATFFQTPIYVLSVNKEGISNWQDYTLIRRKPKPPDLDSRFYKSKCETETYYVTLFRTLFGQYHRIVPRNRLCNCLIQNPASLKVPLHTMYIRQDSDVIHFVNRCRETENLLMAVDVALDNFDRSVIALDAYCEGIIGDLQHIGQNVSIPPILNLSVGSIGLFPVLAFGLFHVLFDVKFKELVLSTGTINELARRRMILEERSDELRTCLENLEDATNHFISDMHPQNLHALRSQAPPGVLRMMKEFKITLIMILRSASRVAVLCDSVVDHLSNVRIVGTIAYLVFKDLRGLRVLLRSMKTHMRILKYGTETKAKEYLPEM